MLITAHVREHFDQVVAGLQKRNIDAAPQLKILLSLDEERRATQATLDQTLAQANAIAKEIGQLFKQGAREEAAAKKQKSAILKSSSKELQNKLEKVSKELNEVLYQLPNIPHPSVPSGNSEEDNEEVFQKGSIPTLDDNALPHWELGKKYKLIDFELGAKITGAGFPVYIGKGAKLQRALINYFLDFNTAAGYGEVQVPHLVNEASGIGTGQLPDKEGQMYHFTEDDLYLIPTAEVILTNIVKDKIVDLKSLPMRFVASTPCFRKEAGSYGKDTKGMIRQHQFYKVEMVSIVEQEKCFEELERMTNCATGILDLLELPYRKMILCSGDMGFSAEKTYDIEVWLPSENKYREISSCSSCATFQAVRMKARYKGPKNETLYAGTLNGSGLAVGRTLIAILENYQTEGGVCIPQVLIPYISLNGKDDFMPFGDACARELDCQHATKAMKAAARKKAAFLKQRSGHVVAANGNVAVKVKAKDNRDSSHSISSKKTTKRKVPVVKKRLKLFSDEGMTWLDERLSDQSYLLGPNGYVASAEDCVVYNALKAAGRSLSDIGSSNPRLL